MEKKIVLITGASSGIGEGCARKFAMNGYRLILNGRNVEKLTAVKRELETEYHADVCLLPFDVRDRGAAKAALDSLPEEWRAIDILINNAGLVIGVDKEHEGNPDEWDIVLDTNIKALLAMTRLVVPGMVERGRGHVINMGSIAGDYAYPGGSVYCASKAAVKALSDGLRIDLVDTPVRVTNIKPGLVETNFSVVRFRGDKAAADNVYKGIRPLTGDDIAEVVYFAMTRLVVPGMVERGRGHVINMGSIAGDYAYPGGSVYCASKAAVKALSDGLRIDLVDTPVRVTNIKPGLVETNFSVVRFRGDKAAADNVYKGIRPLTGDDIAEVVYFAAAVPEHIQVAEVLVMPTNQATGTIVSRK